MAWLPWNVVWALLPASFTDAGKEEERQRRREEIVRAVQSVTQLMLRWSMRLAQFSLVFSVLFAVAALFYCLLYYAVIPSRLHEQEIFFDYGNHAGMVKDGQKTLTLPSATLNLLDPVHQWQASQLVTLPAPVGSALVPGVKYDVFVELNVPESDVNVGVGMFMLQTTLTSAQGEFLASSSRPAIVHDSHSLLRMVRMGVRLIPFALGLMDPAQSIRVLVINGFTETKEHPLTNVSIVLNHPELQIYTARLTIIAQLSGVRYLMYHWSISTALLAILNMVFVEAMGLLILYAFYNMPQPAESSIEMADSMDLDRSGDTTGPAAASSTDQAQSNNAPVNGSSSDDYDPAIKSEPGSSKGLDDAFEVKKEPESTLHYRMSSSHG